MSWTYNDWITQSTDADKLTRLRLHISEVEQAHQASLTSGGDSRDASLLTRYHEQLLERESELEAATIELASTDNRVRAGFTRGRPM